MFAQYSPLFTSGLRLSDSSPSSSRAPSPKRRGCKSRKQHHDSLPVTIRSASLSLFDGVPSDNASNALFLTLKPSRRDIAEGRSFLSLDLAESHRSLSLRRKDTVTSHAGRSAPTSPVMAIPTLPPRPSYASFHVPSSAPAAVVPPRRSSPILRRGSRETLSLPSPKPAPSTTLPEVPIARHRRRPSNLTLTFSACFPEAAACVSAPAYHRATHSEPAILSPPLRSSPILSPGEGRSYWAFSPTLSTPSTPPLTNDSGLEFAMGPAYTHKVSPSFRSVASINTRQRNRSAALAALEGRSPGRRRPSIKRPRNFMSMSDDEDDEDESMQVEKELLSVLAEEEDVVIPKSVRASVQSLQKDASRRSSKTSSETKRSRRSTLDSLLSPLTNFIDLRDDDNSTRSWRSFVEFPA
ncbi:hypothetical protein PsYK624_094480 [Phanerochaete sordida]|uniref:Uncharacterized protein n=1 Tax=Phanerochaete sordida TaxID=48140 RepID=A0A9P3GGM1_9APHY|nr:hypothetical protein PsYK624_094480 [Phanerochaete sordida]